MIYILLFILILYCVLKYDIHGDHDRCYAYYVIFVFLFSLSGFAYRIGSDIVVYMDEYVNVSWQDCKLSDIYLSQRQPLWILFTNICRNITDNFSFFKILISLIVNGIVFFFFYKCSAYKYTCILFYYIMMSFDMNFNILRQALAIIFFLLSYNEIQKSHVIKAYFYIICSVLFHNSAVFLLLVPLVYYFNINKYHKYIFLLLGICFLAVQFFSFNELLILICSLFADETFIKLAKLYLEGDYGTNSNPFILFTSALFFYVNLLILKSQIEMKMNNYFLNLLAFYMVLSILSSKTPIFGRFVFYFTPFYIIALANFVYYMSRKFAYVKVRRCVAICLIFIFSFSPIKYFFTTNVNYDDKQLIQYYPYYSIFDKKIDNKRENKINYEL